MGEEVETAACTMWGRRRRAHAESAPGYDPQR